jgi:hypothetical protein
LGRFGAWVAILYTNRGKTSPRPSIRRKTAHFARPSSHKNALFHVHHAPIPPPASLGGRLLALFFVVQKRIHDSLDGSFLLV